MFPVDVGLDCVVIATAGEFNDPVTERSLSIGGISWLTRVWDWGVVDARWNLLMETSASVDGLERNWMGSCSIEPFFSWSMKVKIKSGYIKNVSGSQKVDGKIPRSIAKVYYVSITVTTSWSLRKG